MIRWQNSAQKLAFMLSKISSIFHTNKRFARNGFTINMALAGLLFAFVIAYGWLALSRHARFNSTGYDLAIHEQILWNTLDGRFFGTSLEVDNSFADHFRPLMVALLPLYALFPTPKTLLVIQAVVLAVTAVPLFWLVEHKLKNRSVALVIAAMYLLYPAVGFVARFDFHMEAITVPLFMLTFYAIERKRWQAATVYLILALLCKENMGIVVAMVGVYAWIMHRQWRWGITWLLLGMFSFIFISFWLLPTIRGESLDAMERYAWMGNNLIDMGQTAFTNPRRIWDFLVRPERLRYLVQLFIPVGFLAFLGLPELLIVLPFLMTNLLADHFCQSTIYCHYAAPLIPFVFIGLVFGLTRLKKWLKEERKWQLAVWFILPLAIGAFWVDNPFQNTPLLPDALVEIGNAEVVKQALTAVPSQLSVVTTNDYAPHLAQREKLYIIGVPSQREAPADPDVVFFNLYDQQYIICDGYRAYVEQLDIDTYGVTFRTGGLIVIQRNAGSNEQFRDFVLNWNNCAG